MGLRGRASPAVAALLSGLIPGLGHLFAGHRRRGVALLGFTLIVAMPVTLVGIALLFSDGKAFALDLIRPFFEHPGYLLLLLAANAAVLAFRSLAALDAYWLAGGGFAGKRFLTVAALLAVFAMAVAAPHAWAAQRNLALYDLLTYDYSVDPTQAAVTTTITMAIPPSTSTSTTSAVTSSSTTVAPTTTSTTLARLPRLPSGG